MSTTVFQIRGGADNNNANNPATARSSSSITLADLTPMAVASYAAATVLAGVTVALVRQVPRSGGHAPRWVRAVRTLCPWVSPDAAALCFHLAYVVHTGIVLYVMPSNIQEIVFSPGGVILLGTVFPIVESIRAASSDGLGDDKTWLQVNKEHKSKKSG